MPQQQVTTTMWLAIPRETRSKIAKLFNLPKTGIVEMHFLNGVHEMRCDGYTHADLANLTIERMQSISKSTTTDLPLLLQGVVAYAEALDGDLVPTFITSPPTESPAASQKVMACCGSKGTRHMKTCTKVPA